MAEIKVYGIGNCDTVKKTLSWFKANKIEIVFHDYKMEGITKQKLLSWVQQTGWQLLLNKKSTTWRNLSVAEQEKITTEAAAIQTMMNNTTLIKRPVTEYKNKIIVGFDEADYSKHFFK